MNICGIFDADGNWIATDKDGAPLPTPEAREDRIAKALESIAASLQKIANPLRMVAADGTVRTLEDSLQFAGYKIVRDDSGGPDAMWFSKAPVGGLRESGPA